MDSRENLYEHEKWGRRVEGKLQKRTCFVADQKMNHLSDEIIEQAIQMLQGN